MVGSEVPLIDIGPLIAGRGEEPVIDQIARAAETFGFFQVVGHGIAPSHLDRVWEQARSFFAMDRSRKLQLLRTKENSRGFFDRELTKRSRDQKEVFDFAHVPFPKLADDHPDNFAIVDGYNRWPDDRPEFRAVMRAHLLACTELSLVLLGGFSRSLGLGADRLHHHFGRHHTSFVRLNWYPLVDPLEPPEAESVAGLGDMALHHHTDAGAFTILLQDDVGGLQVHHGEGWLDVEPVEGALVVNTGDMMQVWSNDRYRAALHRVRPMGSIERYSLPYFFNPSYATDYAPIVMGEAPRYRSINWGEFRQGRADGDFADYGEEIQISRFRRRGPGR